MVSEYRLSITVTFNAAADRDAAFNTLKTQIQTYNTNNPGKMKSARSNRDDYFIADANISEQIV